MRVALEEIPEIRKVQTDLASQTCQIVLKDKTYDIKAKLDELAKGNEHLAGWSLKGS